MSANYLHKANEDFENRTRQPGVVVPDQTAFIFVTPRIWRRPDVTLEAWQQNERQESAWKDVRVIDRVGLEDWLEQHPAVAARLAREIVGNVPQTGVRSGEEFWDEYAARFKPALTEAVLLCDRTKQADDLIPLVLGEPEDILVRADSPDEVTAFVIAAVSRAEDEIRKFLEARLLVLDTEDAARQYGGASNMVLIVRGTAAPVAGRFAQRNVVIVPTGRDSPGRREAMTLNRPTTESLAEAIATMGLPEESARYLARTCGRSVTVLARRIPRGEAATPPWAGGRRTLIPALLAGGWSEDSAEDRSVVSRLANVGNYADYEGEVRSQLRFADPPIELEGSVWKIRAPVDAFVNLGYLIVARI